MPDTRAARREVWITGIGLVSSLGEGLEAHWEALTNGQAPITDATTFAPYVVHPLVKVSFDSQIPKKGDQRQMEPWQRIGTYAAGLALEAAGIAKNTEILSKTDMIVAAGGGERDFAVDAAILNDLSTSNDPGRMLNERLLSDLRPTLSLAQLSNLLAGNISIVHGVTGSSRTFMGEESAGVEAVRIAHARIASNQSEIGLVGGAYNAEREDTLLLNDLDDFCLKGEFRPVFSKPEPGIAAGSMGAFLVLESPEHAKARGATPIAKLSGVWSERARRQVEGALGDKVRALLATVGADGANAIISCATGARDATTPEAEALAATGRPVRAVSNRLGHGFEAQFIAGLALGALCVSKGALYPALAGDPLETAGAGVSRVVVTSVGHWRGEGAGVVEKI
ncbi:beta-ketoacyl-ACP synthase [Xanthobacter agilis]|uniref:3-oxoacyl-[acyl-carrier-protein] synthase II n=1 Tax=Xanthobacter agilis TaxID=47492 RepID=A0ABU0LGR0_XANAG|nr:beta-ketoacyl-ACP synthase [Xanthobacter agilis]MDQ0506331.1 3-oxoacyl-[acyl-carrier-protein] synthase II [Xanthobacter agilis]